MAVSRTLLRAVAQGGADPGACLERVNRQLLRDSSAGLFVTLFYAILDPRTGELRYSLGGHNPPYLLRAGAPLESLDGPGLVVGVLEGAVYETRRVMLRPGDGLFVYTDGVPEARNEAGELFSEDRLRAALWRAGDAGPEELVRAVLEDVHHFSGGAAQSDDITTLALRYTGPAPAGQGVRP
jgi:sigma-B regulation protein RsbU (phosphoserine phosphatase)